MWLSLKVTSGDRKSNSWATAIQRVDFSCWHLTPETYALLVKVAIFITPLGWTKAGPSRLGSLLWRNEWTKISPTSANTHRILRWRRQAIKFSNSVRNWNPARMSSWCFTGATGDRFASTSWRKYKKITASMKGLIPGCLRFLRIRPNSPHGL